jgi:CHASE2 domain-containing sensor protein
MDTSNPYWFPAKHYGWGWGLPLTWQGWVVLAIYAVLFGVATWVFPPHQRPMAFGLAVALVSLALIGVCWVKGEPPAWRWGR